MKGGGKGAFNNLERPLKQTCFISNISDILRRLNKDFTQYKRRVTSGVHVTALFSFDYQVSNSVSKAGEHLFLHILIYVIV